MRIRYFETQLHDLGRTCQSGAHLDRLPLLPLWAQLPLESSGKCDILHRSANAATEAFYTAVEGFSGKYGMVY